jgi:pilus assembly protein Flp/PilA
VPPTSICQTMVAATATIILDEGNPLMLKSRFKAGKAVRRLRTDKDGVVSFEYLVAAACIIGSVTAVFGGGGGGTIQGALTGGVAAIVNAIAAAV